MKSASPTTLVLAALAAVLIAAPAAAGFIQQPVADANGPYVITLGDDLTLDGSGSVDPFSIDAWNWDLDFDGQYDDASGEMVTLSGGTNYDGFFGALSDGDMRTVGLEVVCGVCETTTDSTTASVSFVPEPVAALLLAIALSTFGGRRRRG